MKSPNFVRYERVAHILTAEADIRARFSGKTQAICRPPTNAVKEFPVEAIYVTDAIHAQGEDAQAKDRNEILTLARQLLTNKEIQPPANLPAQACPDAVSPKTAEISPPKRRRGRPPKVKPPEAAVSVAAGDNGAARAAVSNELPAPDSAKTFAPLGVPSSQELENHVLVRWVPVSSPPLQAARCGMAAPVGISAAVLLIHAAHLLQLHGGEKMKPVVEKLDELILFVQRNTVIPADYAEAKNEQAGG